jgi:hypothetical protein
MNTQPQTNGKLQVSSQQLELPPELKKIADEFRDMKKEAGNFLNNVKSGEFNKRPADNGWSIAECIDHLIVTGVDYCDIFEKGLKKLAEKNARYTGEMKSSYIGSKFIQNVEPPVKRKFKSPGKWRPDSKINKEKATTAFLQLQDRWIDLVNQSAGWDLTKVKLPSPAVSWIKFSAFVILQVNSAHQRRHLWQAKNVKKSLK